MKLHTKQQLALAVLAALAVALGAFVATQHVAEAAPPVCGDNVRAGAEDCDGTDAASCPSQCRVDCTCPSLGERVAAVEALLPSLRMVDADGATVGSVAGVEFANSLHLIVYLSDVDRFVYVHHASGLFSNAAIFFDQEGCVGEITLATFSTTLPDAQGIVYSDSAQGRLWETISGPGLFRARSRLTNDGECLPFCGSSSGCNIIDSYRAIEVSHPSWPPTLPLMLEAPTG